MDEKPIAIYHRVMRHENFEAAATDLFVLLQQAQLNTPNKPRALFLDFEGFGIYKKIQ